MTLGYLLKQSRPRFWLYLAGPVLVGLVYGADSLAALDGLVAPLLFLYFLVPANVFLYGINDIFDRDIDEVNPKKEGREVQYRGDRMTIGAVAISALLGLGLLFIVADPAKPWIAGFLVLGAGYSVPPVRFKVRPFLDSFSNGLYILPGAAAYAAIAGVQPPIAAVAGGWLWSMAMHTFSAIPDIEPDRAAGIRTTATVLGARNALHYTIVVWAGAAVTFWTLDWRAGVLLGVYPVLAGWYAIEGTDIDTAYWWYPSINAVVGGVLTIAGLWRVTYGL